VSLDRADQESLHRYSSRNRALLERSDRAGCFYCQSLFDPKEIVDWIDSRQVETGDTADGVTALCPRCGIDSVLPSAAPITLTKDLLSEMNEHWF
jgi:hypothetical protein